MKKKIKDLTFEEREKICHQHLNCDGCPLKEESYLEEKEVEIDEL